MVYKRLLCFVFVFGIAVRTYAATSRNEAVDVTWRLDELIVRDPLLSLPAPISSGFAAENVELTITRIPNTPICDDKCEPGVDDIFTVRLCVHGDAWPTGSSPKDDCVLFELVKIDRSDSWVFQPTSIPVKLRAMLSSRTKTSSITTKANILTMFNYILLSRRLYFYSNRLVLADRSGNEFALVFADWNERCPPADYHKSKEAELSFGRTELPQNQLDKVQLAGVLDNACELALLAREKTVEQIETVKEEEYDEEETEDSHIAELPDGMDLASLPYECEDCGTAESMTTDGPSSTDEGYDDLPPTNVPTSSYRVRMLAAVQTMLEETDSASTTSPPLQATASNNAAETQPAVTAPRAANDCCEADCSVKKGSNTQPAAQTEKQPLKKVVLSSEQKARVLYGEEDTANTLPVNQADDPSGSVPPEQMALLTSMDSRWTQQLRKDPMQYTYGDLDGEAESYYADDTKSRPERPRVAHGADGLSRFKNGFPRDSPLKRKVQQLRESTRLHTRGAVSHGRHSVDHALPRPGNHYAEPNEELNMYENTSGAPYLPVQQPVGVTTAPYRETAQTAALQTPEASSLLIHSESQPSLDDEQNDRPDYGHVPAIGSVGRTRPRRHRRSTRVPLAARQRRTSIAPARHNYTLQTFVAADGTTISLRPWEVRRYQTRTTWEGRWRSRRSQLKDRTPALDLRNNTLRARGPTPTARLPTNTEQRSSRRRLAGDFHARLSQREQSVLLSKKKIPLRRGSNA